MGFKKRKSEQSDSSAFLYDYDAIQDDSFVSRNRKVRRNEVFFDEDEEMQEEITSEDDIELEKEEQQYGKFYEEELDEDTPLEELPPEEDTYVEEDDGGDDGAIKSRRRLKRGLALFTSLLILAVVTIPTIISYKNSREDEAYPFVDGGLQVVFPSWQVVEPSPTSTINVSQHNKYAEISVSSNYTIENITLKVCFYDASGCEIASEEYSSGNIGSPTTFNLLMYYEKPSVPNPSTGSSLTNGSAYLATYVFVNTYGGSTTHKSYMENLDPSKIYRVEASIVSISYGSCVAFYVGGYYDSPYSSADSE